MPRRILLRAALRGLSALVQRKTSGRRSQSKNVNHPLDKLLFEEFAPN
jgi:hypothetical protein